jgi:hypothetical protein
MRQVIGKAVLGMLAAALLSVGAAQDAGAATKRASLGKWITVSGDLGDKARVRAYDMHAPRQDPPDANGTSYDAPPAGKEWLAIRLSIKNLGRDDIEFYTFGNAQIVTSGGRTVSDDSSTVDECGDQHPRVPRGEVRRVCVLFAVPKASRATKLELDVFDDGGQVAQWRLPRR